MLIYEKSNNHSPKYSQRRNNRPHSLTPRIYRLRDPHAHIGD